MLRVTVEYWPGGAHRTPEIIGVMEIINDGTGDNERGNYRVLGSFKNESLTRRQSEWKLTAPIMVKGHARRRGAWRLVQQALEEWWG